ncbi:hypothetical protein [Sphingomonas sp.]|uniref:hypothetical protein n=1 Tax=Sphingomonas sp. TaxID=28214 RepID=UPI002DD6920B|nr:hypothetical protein [Sphingomonas sp.]
MTWVSTNLMRNRALGGAAALCAIMATQPALARESASGSFQISATVPLACWVNHTTQADPLTGTTGQVTEGCNSPAGYTVSVMHRPLSLVERAELIYGSHRINLSAIGTQEVHRQYGPRIQQIAYRFGTVSLETPITLSMTIQPI